MLFLIHQEQADTRHVENSIHWLFPKEEANLSDKKSTSPQRALKAKGSQLHTYQAAADSSNKLMGSSAKHIDSTVVQQTSQRQRCALLEARCDSLRAAVLQFHVALLI